MRMGLVRRAVKPGLAGTFLLSSPSSAMASRGKPSRSRLDVFDLLLVVGDMH